MLLQDPGLNRGAVTPSSLPHSHLVIGDVHPHLIEIFTQLDLRLSKLQLVDSIVGLRLIVSERRLKIGRDAIGGEITPKNLTQGSADPAVKIRIGGLDAKLALYRPRRAG